MFSRVTTGRNVPNDLNVIIEIAANSDPVKYELDKETGLLCVDRFIASNMRYPCDYGYLPQTLSEDGDPVDVLVLSPYPLLPGSLIRVRPVGVLNMTDESGKDAKILSVPIDSLSPLYQHIKSPEDIPAYLLEQICHFFKHYKALEKDKWVEIDGFEDAEQAKIIILASQKRFEQTE